MAKEIPVTTIAYLLSLNGGSYFDCDDHIAEKDMYGIGNACIPDHELLCDIPKALQSKCGHKKLKVRFRVLWLGTNGARRYKGLVVDKEDLQIYFADIDIGDSDSSGFCVFIEAKESDILRLARRHNPVLQELVEIANTDRKRLLDFQVYSIFSDRFCYMEVPMGDRVVLCGAGLHSNKLLAVGWLGKLINKDLFVSYAECSPEVYAQIKQETPSLYQRGQTMEKYTKQFSYHHTFFEKRKKYARLAELMLLCEPDPPGRWQAEAFFASPNGTEIELHSGAVLHWMEEFIMECRRVLPAPQ